MMAMANIHTSQYCLPHKRFCIGHYNIDSIGFGCKIFFSLFLIPIYGWWNKSVLLCTPYTFVLDEQAHTHRDWTEHDFEMCKLPDKWISSFSHLHHTGMITTNMHTRVPVVVQSSSASTYCFNALLNKSSEKLFFISISI